MSKNCFKFSDLDLLHSSIPISFKNHSSFRTVFGAILSIFIVTMIIIYAIIRFKILIERKNFSIISNEIQNINGLINFSNIPILFTLYDDKGNNFEDDLKLYNFSVEQIEQIYTDEGESIQTSKQLELERCDRLINSFELLKYFSDYNLTEYTCIKPGQKLITYGVLGDTFNNYAGFRIYVNKCNNEKSDCYDKDIIEQKLKKNLLFMVLFLGYNTDFISSDENKNVEYQIYSNFISVSPYLVKKAYLNFILGKYYLYDNIFYNSKKEYSYFINGERYHESNFESEKKDGDTIAYFSFSYQGRLVEHTKKVEKITETISLIANIFNIIYTIVKIINNYFSKKILFVNIYDWFFLIIPGIIETRPRIMKLNESVNELNSKQNNLEKNMFKFVNKNNKKKKLQSVKTILMSNEKKKQLIKTKIDFFKYYLYPMYISRKKNKNIINIHKKICQYFSLEKFSDLVHKYKELANIKYEKLYNDKAEIINLNYISNKQFSPKNGLIDQTFRKK